VRVRPQRKRREDEQDREKGGGRAREKGGEGQGWVINGPERERNMAERGMKGYSIHESYGPVVHRIQNKKPS
jgi:hypothetical protein